jgi:hypothetical protein
MLRPDASIAVQSAIYVGGCGFALWKGGRSERLVASAMLLEFVLLIPIQDIRHLKDPRYVTLAFDLAVLGTLLFVAFRTNHRWALVAVAFQLLSVLTLTTRMIDPSVGSWAYITIGIAWGYGLLLTLIYAAARHMLQAKRPRGGSNEQR